MVPRWLHVLAIAMVALGFLCAGLIAIDVLRRPQRMWIMNLVWPITGLFGTVPALWGYFRWGRSGAGKAPFPVMVGRSATHCGAGCTLGDIGAEWLAVAVPAIAATFGYGSLFGEKMFAVWIFDFILAFIFGIAFQYFTIAPMRGLSFGPGLAAALKADALSLTAWQAGMYGFMAIAQFLIFRGAIGIRLEAATFEFWFMMQIAMLCGFATSYPVNWWLLKRKIKEPM
jgi:hypothetical protein